MVVNFNCGKCGYNYNYEVVEPRMDEEGYLEFKNHPMCPKCGIRGEELLSELGQSQMTDWHLGDIGFD